MNQNKLHSFPRGPVSILGASRFPEETLSCCSNQSFISSYDVLSITCTFRLQQEFQFLCVLINAESRPADAISVELPSKPLPSVTSPSAITASATSCTTDIRFSSSLPCIVFTASLSLSQSSASRFFIEDSIFATSSSLIAMEPT